MTDAATTTDAYDAYDGNIFPAVTMLAREALAPEDVNLVLYHAGCPDGLAAAWVMRHLRGADVSCIPVAYHSDGLPEVAGKNVLVVDFSFSTERHRLLAEQAATFVVLDHHKSAVERLGDEPNCFFDMNYSGARLAWHYAYGEIEAPQFIRLIEDRDIWRFAFGDTTRAYHLATIEVGGPTFDLFDKHVQQRYMDEVLSTGRSILPFADKRIQDCARTVDRMELFRDPPLRVGVVSTPLFISEVGNAIASKPEFDVAMIYTQNFTKNHLRVALRSASEEIDVSRIAALYGGGGHACAAGFTVNGGDIKTLLVNMFNLPNPLVAYTSASPSV